MTVTCRDFEGVLISEIWKGLASLSGIDDLKLTTRDIEDYDELIRYRLIFFVEPLLHKLQRPTVFCHSLKLDDDLRIADYYLRQKEQEKHAVKALKQMNFHIVAVGDSTNDISMLQETDQGVFFRPTKKIADEYSLLPVTHKFDALKNELEQLRK